jgi:hypothetical protein
MIGSAVVFSFSALLVSLAGLVFRTKIPAVSPMANALVFLVKKDGGGISCWG